MKTIASVTAGVFLLCLTISALKAQQISAGIFHAGDSTLEVRLRASDTVPALPLSNIVFTVRWLDAYGVGLGDPSSAAYSIEKQGIERTSGSYRYQKFAAATAQTLNWSANTQISVMTVPVRQTGSGSGSFELADDSWTAANNGEYYAEIAGLDRTGSLFQPDAGGVPLPVALSSFYAVPDKGAVLLIWKCECAAPPLGFDIERRYDCGVWKRIGTVYGTDKEEHRGYRFLDPFPAAFVAGDRYAAVVAYRLRFGGADGLFEYSQTVEVMITGGPPSVLHCSVHPNPAAGPAVVSFSLPAPGAVSAAVFNLLGMPVRNITERHELPAGVHTLGFDAGSLAPGVYFLLLRTPEATAAVRFRAGSGKQRGSSFIK
jgi:hypothetical protein